MKETVGSINLWGSNKTSAVSFTKDDQVLFSRYDGPVNIASTLDDEHSADLLGNKNFRIGCFDCGKPIRDEGMP